MHERVRAILFFLFVGSIAGYFVYKEATRVGTPGVINIGQMAPDFTIKDRKFQMLTLAVDTDWKPVNEFYAKHNLTVPVFLDPGQQVARGLYKITGVPETFLIEGNGHVVKHTFGEHWADPRIVAFIESLIQQQDAKL